MNSFNFYLSDNFFIYPSILSYEAFLVAQLVKNMPAMQETLVRFLGQKYTLEKG